MNEIDLRLQEGHKIIDGNDCYALGISLRVCDEDKVSDLMRHINESIYNWLESRGGQGISVLLAFSCSPVNDQEVINWSGKIFAQRSGIFKSMENIEQKLTLLNVDGSVRTSIVIQDRR